MDVGIRPLGDLAPACGVEAIERIAARAASLQGMRVLHVTVAGGGGGVPDLLGALLPLAAASGLAVEWRVLFGGADLTGAGTALRRGMEGAETAIGDSDWGGYVDACRQVAEQIEGEWDAVVLHDPAALGLVGGFGEATTIWRCHVDASHPDAPAWDRAQELALRCQAVVMPDTSFAPPGIDDVSAIPPGIDPLSARNFESDPRVAGRALRRLGLDLDRPLVSQLMRLDRWGDPHTAIEAFGLLRERMPQLQLVIACELGEGADGWPAVKEISDYAGGQENLHLLTSYSELGNLELGALNRLSRVALRLSLHEGFGLGASEAMWRDTPVVGGREGGTPLQVRDGVDGYLVSGAEEVAARVAELIDDPGLATEMGRAGRERVRERFLVTRVLEDELRLLAALAG